MSMSFRYQQRDPSVIQRHASASGGDFETFLRPDVTIYKPKPGDNYIRILPPTWEGADYYALEVFVHYNLGPDGASAICLNKMANQPCPACEARMYAEQAGDEDTAQELKPSKRMLMWIIDRNDEQAGVFAWPCPHTLNRDIAAASIDKHTGHYYHIDDPENGYDVIFEKTGTQRGTRYIGVQVARNPTTVDPYYLDFIVQNPLPDLLIWRTYQEVLELYEGGPVAEGARPNPPVQRRANAGPPGNAGRAPQQGAPTPGRFAATPSAQGRRPMPPNAAPPAPARPQGRPQFGAPAAPQRTQFAPPNGGPPQRAMAPPQRAMAPPANQPLYAPQPTRALPPPTRGAPPQRFAQPPQPQYEPPPPTDEGVYYDEQGVPWTDGQDQGYDPNDPNAYAAPPPSPPPARNAGSATAAALRQRYSQR